MQLMIAFAFLFLVFFFLLLFRIDSNTIKVAAEEAREKKPKTFEVNFKKKQNRLSRLLNTLKEMLEAMGQRHRFYGILGITLILAVVGSSFGITTANFYLVPVFTVGFACAPFLYLRFQLVKYNRMVIEEAEIALSTISLSYERTENILQAIEENLENIHAPIQRIFQEFVNTVKYSNPNVEASIDKMKGKINHSVWMEWCDALKRCSRDRSLKHILRPIVGCNRGEADKDKDCDRRFAKHVVQRDQKLLDAARIKSGAFICWGVLSSLRLAG